LNCGTALTDGSNTNATIVEMHRELFPDRANPPIKLEEFEHYLYWHNRGWGTQKQTVAMVVSSVACWVGDVERCGVETRATGGSTAQKMDLRPRIYTRPPQ